MISEGSCDGLTPHRSKLNFKYIEIENSSFKNTFHNITVLPC